MSGSKVCVVAVSTAKFISCPSSTRASWGQKFQELKLMGKNRMRPEDVKQHHVRCRRILLTSIAYVLLVSFFLKCPYHGPSFLLFSSHLISSHLFSALLISTLLSALLISALDSSSQLFSPLLSSAQLFSTVLFSLNVGTTEISLLNILFPRCMYA